MAHPIHLMSITCVTCRLAFGTFEDQRVHFQTEYHRENSKRSLEGKPPMTQAEYLEFLIQLKAERLAADSKKKRVYHCTACNKNFSSENAFRQHCDSGKHAAAAEAQRAQVEQQTGNQLTAMNRGILGDRKPKGPAQQGQALSTTDTLVITEHQLAIEPKERLPAFLAPEEHETFRKLLPQLEQLTDSQQDDLIRTEIFDKRERLPANRCLFCEVESADVTALLEHMYAAHSFKLPMQDYVPDVPLLIAELQKQVAVARCCLVCFKGFNNTARCQSHMRAAGHTVLEPERFAQEFADFYDFSSSYPPEMLRLAQESGDAELLGDVRRTRYYVRLEDLNYIVDGEEVTYQEWKEWKRAHVPEWLKVRQRQTELLFNLRTLRGDVFQAPQVNAAPEAPQDAPETRIQLKPEVQQIVDQVNQLGAALAAKGCKDVIQITDANATQYLQMEAVPRPAEIREAQRNKYDTQVFENERLNHDKPFFKRSTLHIYN